MGIISTAEDAIPGVAQGKLILAGIAFTAFAVPTIGWTVTAHTLHSRTEQRDTLQHWQTNVIEVTSAAAGVTGKNGKPALLAADQVPTQIQYLSGNLAECHHSLDDKNGETIQRGKDRADAIATYQQKLADLKKEGAAQAEKLAYWQGMAAKYQAEGSCPIDVDLAKELNR